MHDRQVLNSLITRRLHVRHSVLGFAAKSRSLQKQRYGRRATGKARINRQKDSWRTIQPRMASGNSGWMVCFCMSSKGQVVIPEDIRKRLGLETGAQFVVIGEDDTVILKVIAAPEMGQFDDLISRARKQARRAGLKRSDIASAVDKARAHS